jgi:small nuclear ribonucleoprotein G
MDKRISRKIFPELLPRLFRLFLFFLLVKLNAGRKVSGILRGYDLFMNLVLDEATEDISSTEKIPIGMIVSNHTPA